MIAKFSKKKLENDILHEAKVLGIGEGSAKVIAEKVSKTVFDWTKGRSEVTEDDILRITIKELKRYNEDLSYAYDNRNKII